ncbi:MAG: porin family protein [Ignavibacteria bacterium]|nr:porin family protein [Ignavibacteria bacterium]
MQNSSLRIASIVVLVFFTVSIGFAQTRSGKLGIGVAGTGYYLFQSDLKTNDPSGGGAVSLTYSIVENISLRSLLGVGYLAGTQKVAPPATTGKSIETNLYHWNLAISYDILPHSQFNPFVYVGGGLLWFDPRESNGAQLAGAGVPRFDTNYLAGIGFDYFFDEFWAITLSAEGVGGFNSWLDGTKTGTNDMYARVSLGLRFHVFDQNFVKRMIDAFEQRGK